MLGKSEIKPFIEVMLFPITDIKSKPLISYSHTPIDMEQQLTIMGFNTRER